MKRWMIGLWALLAAISLTTAVRAEWTLLGTAQNEVRIEKSVVDIVGNPGPVSAIRLVSRQGDVEVLNLRVTFGNGRTQDLPVQIRLVAGASSKPIDLPGQERGLRQIVVTFRVRGPARIDVLGDTSALASWELLGCKSVGFLVDRDIIPVGRMSGRFKAIRLRVGDNPIEVFKVRVVYGSGKADDLEVRRVIPAGGETRPLDLRGEARGIDRVELVYRAIPTFKFKSKVCVEGLATQ